ncbi:Putative protein [Zobellia galactanivorans]|uniref:Uncharacterized protein n=1 Tax=Zobellia galactanivorans (strain DSM 12802 / CCUG 47099 / CIP 106680 / NCIMB 13871 / Dsij) TaxID=63186 RepID=G0L504_ZOBGA|nr:Putative protein [Zobellia galactanivorans]
MNTIGPRHDVSYKKEVAPIFFSLSFVLLQFLTDIQVANDH